MTTGQRIKSARKEAGLTQAELATKLGIPYQSIGQWERDIRKPKYGTLLRIADALGTKVSELLSFDEQVAWHGGWLQGTRDENKFWESYISIMESVRTFEGKELISSFERLNEAGQKEAVKRVAELTEIPRYQKHQETDSKEDQK